MQILTEQGFKDYEGFVNQGEKEVFQVNFENGEYLICTDDHRLLLDGGQTYEFISNLKEGDKIYGNGAITSIIPQGNETVYDALNVEETHSYWTNGCISHNCLFLDEFAFVDNASEFYTSTYPVISSGKNSKVIITSTANGMGNMFYTLWEGAVQQINEFAPFRVDWWDVPGRDEEWKKQTIANTSEIQFKQEFGNCLESRSQITILINNIVYEITIGNLYNAIKRKDSSGLSLDEEVRLSAIRWYNYKRHV